MSSTTDRSRERGQVLVLFAGGLATLLIIAALAFDVGMVLLERRDQQNAADAAALAGARYVDPTVSFHGSCAAPGGNPAVIAACEVALANDFNDAGSDEDVFVDIPPVHAVEALHRGPWNIEVRIQANRPSLFGGVIGRAAWPVGVMAIASSPHDVLAPFSMLALNETACKAMQFTGTGVVNANESIQSNSTGSDCLPGNPYGFSKSGNADVNVDGTCRAVGDIQDQGTRPLDCVDEEPFSYPLPDPLRTLEEPDPNVLGLAPTMKEWVSGSLITPTNADIPNYCPGKTSPPSRVPEMDDPQLCVLGNGSDAGRVFVLSPGVYPGGLDLRGGVTAYLLPGIYFIGGGGFKTSGDASVISVDNELDTLGPVCTTGATPPCVGGGGVLIYNSELPYNGGEGDKIILGGGGAILNLMPYNYPFPSAPAGFPTTIDLVIWQDRDVSLGGDDVTLNGSSAAATSVRGVVYLPEGDLKINGSASEFTMDQVIAQTFLVDGSGGTINVLREYGIDAVISAAGLVE